ncbi:MAG: S9 family peptidase [Planctomycetes bacterium]|nr:S9 family peptidase [Planctomycetota bacterium]
MNAQHQPYPETRKLDLVESLHGVEVADPYRWLEDDVRVSKEVRAWVEAQNRVTFDFLGKIPERERIRARLAELWDFERVSAPFEHGGRWYQFRNDGLQNQSVLFTMAKPDGEGEVFLDPNAWTADGTAALAGLSFSEDGAWLAVARAESGSDWRKLRVMEVATGRWLDDELSWLKYSGSVSWTRDGKGFFYTRYPEPREGEEFQSLNLGMKILYHRLGSRQAQDVLVFEKPEEPRWSFGAQVSDDGRYLIITARTGTSARQRVFVRDLLEPYGTAEVLVDAFENRWDYVGSDGSLLYFHTDLDAPRGRVVARDLRRPAEIIEIVPEREETIEHVAFIGDLLHLSYLKDAHSEVRVHRRSGEFLRRVALPGLGTASGFAGERDDTDCYFSFSSFTRPGEIWHYDAISGETTIFRRPELKFDPEDYLVEQVFYGSKDGTRVPMFLAHRKGLARDGKNPTLLYGYGGFNISLTPSFSVARLAWMEMGGVLAIANLRGGGEYGEAWHEAGTRQHKQNVFDDFIAAAEWLTAEKYCDAAHLAIQGGSNGGLLVGACMTQRPELFGACLPAVGVMDMLRFHKFTAGRFWVDDYGSPDDPDDFAALRAYSPYHNLKAGRSYPATLVTTADTDDRVVPGHSFKFIAALQAAQAGPAPTLIRIETSAGHGAGTPTSKLIESHADQWAFLVATLHMKLAGD